MGLVARLRFLVIQYGGMPSFLLDSPQQALSHVSPYQVLADVVRRLFLEDRRRDQLSVQIEQAPLDVERPRVQRALPPEKVLARIALPFVPTCSIQARAADRSLKTFGATAADESQLGMVSSNDTD